MGLDHLPAALQVWQDRQIEFAIGVSLLAISFTGIAAWSCQLLKQAREESPRFPKGWGPTIET